MQMFSVTRGTVVLVKAFLGRGKSRLQQPYPICVPPGWRRGHQQEEVGVRLEAALWDELCSHPHPSAARRCCEP